jgi:hypothetical protein
MCGQVSDQLDDGVFADLWSSADGGITWTQTVTNLPFAGQNLTGTVSVYNGLFYLVAGGMFDRSSGGLYRTVSAQVWISADKGKNWTRLADAPFRPRQYANTIVFDNRLWVIGGSDTVGQNMRDVWYMTPDGDWHELGDTPWEERHATSVAVYNDTQLVIACGHLKKDAWTLERVVSCTPVNDKNDAARSQDIATESAPAITAASAAEGIRLSPNPAADHAQLQFSLSAPGRVSVQVYNWQGKSVLPVSEQQLGAGLHQQRIALQQLPAGVYMIRVTTNQKQYNLRLVKQ